MNATCPRPLHRADEAGVGGVVSNCGVALLVLRYASRNTNIYDMKYRSYIMPLPKATQEKPKATAKDVKSAAAVGNAAFAYFKKHGSFPTSKEQLAKG